MALSTSSATTAALAADLRGWRHARRVVVGLVLGVAAAWAGTVFAL